MSPRNRGGKYHFRLHPRSRKCACQFLRETEPVKLECARETPAAWRQRRWSCGALKASFLLHTVFFKETGKFYTIMKYQCFSRSAFFSGIACLMKVRPLFKREFPRALMTWRTARARISNVKSPIDVNKHIRIDFRAVNVFLVNRVYHTVKTFQDMFCPTT